MVAASARDAGLVAAAACAGAALGAALATLWRRWDGGEAPATPVSAGEAARRSLPKRIILLRHGESEGNADHTLYRTKPDNLIELTALGREQAAVAGRRIKDLTAGGTVE